MALTILRIFGGLVLSAFACLFVWFIAVANDPASSKDSWIKSQAIQADFNKVATFIRSFEDVEGRMPQESEMHNWMRSEDFESIYFKGYPESMELLPSGEACVGSDWRANNPKVLQSERLCMWRSEWGEELVIATGETTLPASHEEYLPTAMQNALMVLLVALLSIAALACFQPKILNRFKRKP